jgi:hypothetical protein
MDIPRRCRQAPTIRCVFLLPGYGFWGRGSEADGEVIFGDRVCTVWHEKMLGKYRYGCQSVPVHTASHI